MTELNIIEVVWNELQTQIDSLRSDVNTLLAKSERAETAGGIQAVDTLTDAPLAAEGGVSAGDLLFIKNVRKNGEGAGSGTGTICYYNEPTDQWYRASDDTVAAI